MMIDGPAVGATWQGEYLIQAALGDPAHGVYRALRKRDQQSVTLRLWRAPNDAQARAFLESARAAAGVHERVLARVESYGQHEGFCFIVSEFVAGQKLDVWADQIGIPPLDQVLDLMQHLSEALHVAARAGATHTALHPGNVMMVQVEGGAAGARKYLPKLLDHGVPSFARPSEPPPLTAQFMAPEQLAAVLDAGSVPPLTTTAMNVYSCGALLYYLCTGGSPYRQTNLDTLREAQQQARLALPSRINPSVTASLNAVITQAMALDPSQRFASLDALAEALSQVTLTPSTTGLPALPPPMSGSPGRRQASGPLRKSSTAPRPSAARRTAPPVPRRPSLASQTFEPESETARTGRLGPVTNRPPAEWGQSMVVADEDDAMVSSERPSAPVGSFSSAPPPGQTGKPPPQSVVATPVALFSGSAPNMRVEPALIVTRMDGAGSQLMTSREVVDAQPPARRRFVSFGVLYGTLAALVCLATYGVVRMVRNSDTPNAGVGAMVVAGKADPERSVEPAIPAPPPQPSPPSPPSDVAAAAKAPEPPASAPAEPDEPSVREPAPSRSRGRARSATGAVVASREPRVSPVPPVPITPSGEAGLPAEEPALARPPAPEPTTVAPSFDTSPLAEETVARQPSPRAEPPEPSARAPERRTAPAPEPAPGPLLAKAAVGTIAVRGSMPNSQVRRAIERVRPQFVACYARAARAAGRNEFGSLDVEVEIDERGRARGPSARGSDLPGLNGCVAEAAGDVVSEAPDTGTVRASFKVVFSP